MKEIINTESNSFVGPLSQSQLMYPISDMNSDTFMVVIKLPSESYEEVIVSIDEDYVEVSARLDEVDPLLSLFYDYGAAQTFTTKVRLPGGLDIGNSDAIYRDGNITVYLPYV